MQVYCISGTGRDPGPQKWKNGRIPQKIKTGIETEDNDMSRKGFRKLTCLLFVCLLAVQLCIPGFAEETSDDGYVQLQSSDQGDTSEAADETGDIQTGTDSLQDLGKMRAESKVDDILSGMTLREKVGQMIIASFRGWSDGAENGPYAFTKINSEVSSAISGYRFGGVLLYAENCSDNEETMRLVNDMQKANMVTEGKNAIPLLVSIDQEGGIVTRLRQGTKWTGNMAVAATGDIENARETARGIGRELSLLSINTDFGVVMDVNDNPNNPIIGVRAFSDDTKIVADYGTAFFQGMTESGTIAVLKHFPGHGNTSTDSHTGLPRVEKTLEQLNETELVPFRMGIEAGAEMIMTAHIQYPNLDDETYISKKTGEEVVIPATLSKKILTDILRDKMDFDGVVVTDALEMESITEHFAEDDVYKMAVNAGVDMLLVPCTVYNSGSLQKLENIVNTIVEMAEEGEISGDRIDESVRRILTLKARHGLLEYSDTGLTDEEIRENAEKIWSEETRAKEWDMMKKGLTLLKNDGDVIPCELKENEKVLVLYPGQSRVNTADYARQHLEAKEVIPAGTEWKTMVYDPENAGECIQAALEADHVIAVTTMFEVSEMDPANEDGKSGEVLDRIIEAVHSQDKKITVISAELPYDAARYQDADAIMVTYGSTWMLETADSGAAVSPNLPGAICAVFGEFTPEGKLPVNLPSLNDDKVFSDEILYPRGYSAVQDAEAEEEEKSEDQNNGEEKKDSGKEDDSEEKDDSEQ